MSRSGRACAWVWVCLCVSVSLAEAQAAAGGPSSNLEARRLKNPVQSTSQSIAAGKELFSRNCRSCHGADAKGNGPMKPKDTRPPDLTDNQWTLGGSDGEIYAVLRDGAGPGNVMRGYRGRMTDHELWSVVNYLRSLSDQGAH